MLPGKGSALRDQTISCFGVAAHVIILDLKEVIKDDEPGVKDQV